MMDSVDIKAFRAIDAPSVCDEFAREHAFILDEVGLSSVMQPDVAWMQDPNVYLVVAYSSELGMVGGCRVHVAHSNQDDLPIKNSILPLDERIGSMITMLSGQGIAEICGLWNARRFSGKGIPHVLVMTAISICNQLHARSVFGVAAKYTLNYALRLGLVVVEEIGNKGWFDYPKPGYYGIVTGTRNSMAMRAANPALRRRIISLRIRPQQVAVENTGLCRLHITYDLMIPRSGIRGDTYKQVAKNYSRFSA